MHHIHHTIVFKIMAKQRKTNPNLFVNPCYSKTKVLLFYQRFSIVGLPSDGPGSA